MGAEFNLGYCTATPGAIEAVASSGESIVGFISRHARGDWGEVCEEDKEENNKAVKLGFRIMSAYKTKLGVKLWVITEHDRSSTCILLPEEY